MQEEAVTAAPATPFFQTLARHQTVFQGDAAVERVTLGDGRSLPVRPVGPRDAAAEQAFVANLSPTARFRRFHFGLNELPNTLLQAFVNADQQTHVALVAEADDRRIVADARYVRDTDASTADFAIAISDAWQGFGLGRALMHRILARARSSGIKRLCGDVLVDNAPMLALMNRLEARLTPNPEDDSLYRVCLAL
jgi:acetyltransferase